MPDVLKLFQGMSAALIACPRSVARALGLIYDPTGRDEARMRVGTLFVQYTIYINLVANASQAVMLKCSCRVTGRRDPKSSTIGYRPAESSSYLT